MLGLFVFSVVLVAMSATPANAMRAEECYSTGIMYADRCSCNTYVCYAPGTVSWNGGYSPVGGEVIRQGGQCSNGFGWSGDNSWGGSLGGCFYE